MSKHVQNEDAYAGVDVGGSGFRIRLEAARRTAERRRDAPLPRESGRVDLPRLSRLLVDELRAAMAEVGVTELAGLGIGLTGFPMLVRSAEFDHLLRDELGLDVLVIAGDALTTHVGALGGAGGAVVAAGTGVSALGTDLTGVWNQVDGWGFILGDEGSGAWVGRLGLRAALRAADGRNDGSEVLRQRMLEQFGTPYDLIGHVYPADSPSHALASFAPAVAGAAQAGDPVAHTIWRDAGIQLGQAVVAAARSLPPRISWGGGLFGVGELLLEPFRQEVHRRLPGACVSEPAGTSLDGALILARRAAEGQVTSHPLHVEIFPEPREVRRGIR